MRRPEVSGTEDGAQRLSLYTGSAAQTRAAARCLYYVFCVSLAMTPLSTLAQTQSEIQYTYDAAGRIIGVTRSGNKPDLTVSNLSIGAISQACNGSFTIPVTFQVNNVGAATAVATWYDYGYLSTNTTLHNTDQVLAGYTTRSTNLATGTSYTVNATYTTSTTTTPGSWYLIVKADGGASASGQYSPTGPNYVDELNEYNNTQAVAINLPGIPKPDLTVSNASIGAITTNQNGSYSFPGTFTINNFGSAAAQPTWYDQAFLSTDGVLDNNSVNLSGYNTRSTVLACAASYTATITFSTTATQAAGVYTLFIKADAHSATPTDNGNVAESNEANNTQALALTLPTLPDLTVSNASTGAITVGQNGSYSFPVTYTINNIGGSAAQPTWYDQAFLSANGVLDNNSVNLSGYNTRSTSLAAGSNYTVTTTFSTTATQAAGSYTLFVKADAHSATPTDSGNVKESNETNNTQSLALTLPTLPDLTVSNFSVGTIVKNGNGSHSIPVSFQVNNIGGSAAQPTWYDQGFLSSNGALDGNSVNLSGYNTRSTSLAAGANYTVNITFTTSTTQAAGTYTLFVKADAHSATPTDGGNVKESNETNNTASATVVLP